jgi:hypothetical protein
MKDLIKITFTISLLFSISVNAENRYSSEIALINQSMKAYKAGALQHVKQKKQMAVLYGAIESKSKFLEEKLSLYRKSASNKKRSTLSLWITEKFHTEEIEQELVEITSFIGYSVNFISKSNKDTNNRELSSLKKMYADYEALRMEYRDKKEKAIRQIQIINENSVIMYKKKRYNNRVTMKTFDALSMIAREVEKTAFYGKYAVDKGKYEKLMFYKKKLEGLRYLNHRFLTLGLLKLSSHKLFYEQIETQIQEAFDVINQQLFGLIPDSNTYTNLSKEGARARSIALYGDNDYREPTLMPREIERGFRDLKDSQRDLQRNLDQLSDNHSAGDRHRNNNVGGDGATRALGEYEQHAPKVEKHKFSATLKDHRGNESEFSFEGVITYNSGAEKNKKLLALNDNLNDTLKQQHTKIKAGELGEVRYIAAKDITSSTYEVVSLGTNVQSIVNSIEMPQGHEKVKQDLIAINDRVHDHYLKERGGRHKSDLKIVSNSLDNYKKTALKVDSELTDVMSKIKSLGKKIANNIKSLRKGMSPPEIQALDQMDIMIGTMPVVDVVWDTVNFLSAVAIDHSLTGTEAKDTASKVIYGLGPFIPLVSGGLAVKGAKEAGKIYKYLEKRKIDSKALSGTIDYYASSKANVKKILRKISEVFAGAEKVLKDSSGKVSTATVKPIGIIVGSAGFFKYAISLKQASDAIDVSDFLVESLKEARKNEPENFRKYSLALNRLGLIQIKIVGKFADKTIENYPHIYKFYSDYTQVLGDKAAKRLIKGEVREAY